jgi:hypothetical protein
VARVKGEPSGGVDTKLGSAGERDEHLSWHHIANATYVARWPMRRQGDSAWPESMETLGA